MLVYVEERGKDSKYLALLIVSRDRLSVGVDQIGTLLDLPTRI